jgi:hypothetical protein
MTREAVATNSPLHVLPMLATARQLLQGGAPVASYLLFLAACSSTTDGGGDSAPGPSATSTSPTEPPPPIKPPKTGEEDAGVKSCETSADCTDPRFDVCDPDTRTCIDAQCGANAKQQCAKGKICVYQTAGIVAGVCTDPCSPFGTPCSGGRECQIGSMDGVSGFCKSHGNGAPGAACNISDVTTSCASGYACVADPTSHFCREQCDFFGDKHACSSASTKCVPPGFCITETPDPAKSGDDCAAGSAIGKPCADSNGRLLGVCAGKGTSASPPFECSLWCRMSGNDCPAGKTCKPTGSPSVGYCQ